MNREILKHKQYKERGYYGNPNKDKPKRSYEKKSFTRYYRELGLRPKTIWIHKDTIIKLGAWAAKESLMRDKRVSLNLLINEILNAKAENLPEE